MSFKQLVARAKWAVLKPWVEVMGVFGVGILPCPDCGAPLIVHYWPLALGVSFVIFRRGRKEPRAVDQVANESTLVEPKAEK